SVHELIDNAATQLTDAAKELTNFNTQFAKALDTGNMCTIKKLLSGNTATLSTALSTPVELKRVALFPVDTFGAALT
ncbi:hypothetical protein LIY54_26560, partial [Escherichia coli]|nr:hypothetical protein [Escherichia coli]